MCDEIVTVQDVTRRFGKTVALDHVTLSITRGSVFGLVGENGAGKTTLIKHLLGLFRAQSGSVRVFGLDPVRDPVGVLGPDRLLVRGTRSAGLDARRRVDELHAGVLSALGHPLCGRTVVAV